MNKGFTLIELMIVVAIIGILASVALPSYSDYIYRSQVSEGLSMTLPLKLRIEEYYRGKGKFPASNEDAGLPKGELFLGNYVKGLYIENGAIHIHWGNRMLEKFHDKILTLRPQYVAQNPLSPISWLCGPVEPIAGMQVAGEDKTGMDPSYLPMVCRK